MRVFGTCTKTRHLLWDYSVGVLSEKELKYVEYHLAKCVACRAEVRAYSTTREMVAGFKAAPEPSSRLGFADLMDRVSQATQVRERRRLTAVHFASGAATVAVGACMLMMLVQHRVDMMDTSAPKLASRPQVSTPGADGSVISSGVALGKQDEVELKGSGIAELGGPAASVVENAPEVRPTSSLRRVGPSTAAIIKPHVVRQVAQIDENPDGATSGASTRPDYVLASASSGNDEMQSRRFAIDVVTVRTVASNDSGEELHPW